MALDGPTPNGYSEVFTNLTASLSAVDYMGYHVLDSYDTKKCAAFCNHAKGCEAFNM